MDNISGISWPTVILSQKCYKKAIMLQFFFISQCIYWENILLMTESYTYLRQFCQVPGETNHWCRFWSSWQGWGNGAYKCLHNLKMEKLKFLHKSCFFGGTAGLFLVIIISVSHQHSVVSVGNDTSHSDKYEQPPATVWLVAQLSETTKTSLDHK